MKFSFSSCIFLILSLALSVYAEAELDLDLDLEQASHVRVSRQAPAQPVAPLTPPTVTPKLTPADKKLKYNLADPVSEDYPVIFNMILFISVTLILALIAICVAIGSMDPGRDSLIYRVTSAQKYKKDN